VTFLFFDAARLFFEDLDELVADDLALGFGIDHSRQLLHEAVGGVDCNQMQSEIVAQILLHFSNSFLRSTPLLTKTQVRRVFPESLRMARSTSTAATEESTPPESAQMAARCRLAA